MELDTLLAQQLYRSVSSLWRWGSGLFLQKKNISCLKAALIYVTNGNVKGKKTQLKYRLHILQTAKY